MSDSDSTTAWVSVAEAAEKAQVDSGTVRQWYRSGRIPTRRAEGERGAFLVPLDLVLSLVRPAEPQDATASAAAAPSIEEALRGLNADLWSSETEAAKQDLAAARSELAEAREQLGFLRAQLAEASTESRSLKEQLRAALDDRKGVEARLATVEAELTQLRRTASRGSITDNSWLDLKTPAYQSPVRRQALATPPPEPSPAIPQDGPTSSYAEARTSELSGLLAATRPDDDPDEVGDGHGDGASAAPTPTAHFQDAEPDHDGDYSARAIWTDEAPHPPLGEHDDDLLPSSDKKGRFGKK